jgi:hypothetical protein
MQVVPFDSERIWWMFICKDGRSPAFTLLMDTESTNMTQIHAILEKEPVLVRMIRCACLCPNQRDEIIEKTLQTIAGNWCLWEHDGRKVLKTLGWSSIIYDPHGQCCIQ